MGRALAEEFKIQFFETSAKLNINVDEVFMSITKDVMKRPPTPLTAAIETGNLDKVKRSPDPLSAPIKSGVVEMIKQTLPDPDLILNWIVDSVGRLANMRTPLLIASANACEDVVQRSLERGAGVAKPARATKYDFLVKLIIIGDSGEILKQINLFLKLTHCGLNIRRWKI